MLHRTRVDPQDIIILSGNGVAFDHRRMGENGRLELGVRIEAYADFQQALYGETQRLGHDAGRESIDDALFLQIAHSLPAGRLGQADTLAQFGKGYPSIGLKLRNDLPVDPVHGCLLRFPGWRRIIHHQAIVSQYGEYAEQMVIRLAYMQNKRLNKPPNGRRFKTMFASRPGIIARKKGRNSMAITHVFDSPPPGAAPDWTLPQNWALFTDKEHAIWDKLVARQSEAMMRYACQAFIDGHEMLYLSDRGIPNLEDLNRRLKDITGWQVVAVPGAIPNDAFFSHLSEKRFPAANFLRGEDSLDYSEEPDMFHDLFAHLPALTDPVFADFMVAYGKAGLRAETQGAEDFLGELYVHTVEFGLIAEKGSIKAFGAGMLSSYAETVHAVTSSTARRLRFDLPRVMRRKHLFDEFQKEYFVINSFEELLRVTAETDFATVYRELASKPMLEPGEVDPDDVPFEILH